MLKKSFYSILSLQHTDASDVNNYMERLFSIFNTPTDKREKNTPEYLQKFPYVNGGLFKDVVKSIYYKIKKYFNRSWTT
ncbi:hypothetical protein MASR2M54_03150 [Aliarcobacter cryaerophilus]